MEIKIYQINGKSIAELVSEGIVINETQDALDLMADANYRGSAEIIIHEKNIVAGFFDLKSGIAGEILQKFSTYQARLAIVGDFSRYPSKSLRNFIFESNKYGRINFVGSLEEARVRLAGKPLPDEQ